LRGPLFFSGVAWFQWKSEDAVVELNCRNATVNGNVLHITQVISHLSPHRRTHAASYTWLDVPSVCEFVATTAERTDMPFGGGRGEEFRGPTNHVSLLDGGAHWRHLVKTVDRSVRQRRCGLSLPLHSNLFILAVLIQL